MPRARKRVPNETISGYKPLFLPTPNEANEGKVCEFVPKEVDMMPGDWRDPGNPSPYELRTTIQTCKRVWQLNKDALSHPDCDIEATQYNIKVLEKLYIQLMDYLVE
ncbi:hypothetical protein GHNINEIG_01120 [Hydrogenovibrio crunogenus]|uniref:Uncharacterized protein n=1 Tax=Hydrogenovibrio crunogenus TaxID=39765 RepID=A0A4P7NZN7_9GAMM|nr:hypothetical protein [Hydrogenovibrio crunogenus]QBZ83079.1 hypothetical protein GHNINEIG_01120 [Hydrogenovibrio crunogenus]